MTTRIRIKEDGPIIREEVNGRVGTYQPGDVLELSDDRARQLLQSRPDHFEVLDPATVPETEDEAPAAAAPRRRR